MKRKLAWFGLGFALARLFAAYMPPLVIVLAAALFALLLFLCWQKHAFSFIGYSMRTRVFALYSAIVILPVRQYIGQTAACTAVVQPDRESSYQSGYFRGTLKIIECNGQQTNFLVECDAFLMHGRVMFSLQRFCWKSWMKTLTKCPNLAKASTCRRNIRKHLP